ncbi:MAG: hypothetical protein Q9162_003128 [Coniocarpon cinnabarinum]
MPRPPNCHYPAPKVKPIAGTNLNPCTSTELEHQHIKELDDQATHWLQEGHVQPPDEPSPSDTEGTAAFPDTERRADADFVRDVFIQPVPQGNGDSNGEGGDQEDSSSESLFSVFLSIYDDYPHKPHNYLNPDSNDSDDISSSSQNSGSSGSPAQESSGDENMSLFDLPSARRLSGRLYAAQLQSKNAWKDVNAQARRRVHHARTSASAWVPFLFVFMAVGIVMALAITARSGELIFRCGRSAWNKGMVRVVDWSERGELVEKGRAMGRRLSRSALECERSKVPAREV